MLFNLYIDDLISEIKGLNCGVYIEDEIISILLYADNIALIATNEVDLQKMFDKLSEWCLHWKLMVNGDKTQIVHFRKGPSVPRTDFNFKCGQIQISKKARKNCHPMISSPPLLSSTKVNSYPDFTVCAPFANLLIQNLLNHCPSIGQQPTFASQPISN